MLLVSALKNNWEKKKSFSKNRSCLKLPGLPRNHISRGVACHGPTDRQTHISVRVSKPRKTQALRGIPSHTIYIFAWQSLLSLLQMALGSVSSTVADNFRTELPKKMRLPPWNYDGPYEEGQLVRLKMILLLACSSKLENINSTLAMGRQLGFHFFQGSVFSLYLHDSVYMYALATEQLLQEGGYKRNGSRIFEISKNKTFDGTWI